MKNEQWMKIHCSFSIRNESDDSFQFLISCNFSLLTFNFSLSKASHVIDLGMAPVGWKKDVDWGWHAVDTRLFGDPILPFFTGFRAVIARMADCRDCRLLNTRDFHRMGVEFRIVMRLLEAEIE